MLFRKSSGNSQPPPFAGHPELLTGREAVEQVESAAGSAYTAGSTVEQGWSAALCGQRTAARLTNAGPGQIAGLAPLVLHLECGRNDDEWGHDAYYSLAQQEFFQLFAAGVQEAMDLTLIAHRISELALIPGVCALDSLQTGLSQQTVQAVDTELAAAYLGFPQDLISSPTTAQTLLFGKQRRRIPRLLNIDHPLGIGVRQLPDLRLKTAAARQACFQENLPAFVQQAMSEFATLTGRSYAPLAGYRCDDAEYLVIARGAVINDLRRLADDLRQSRSAKLGVINITMFRPFPEEALSGLLQGKKGITVLEQGSSYLKAELPLAQLVRAVLGKSLENGIKSRKDMPYPGIAACKKPADRPELYAGIYAPAGRLSDYATLSAAIDNMLDGGERKRLFFAGINPFPEQTHYPILEVQQQQLKKAYPGLEQMTLSGTDIPVRHISGTGKIQLISLFQDSLETVGALLARAFFAAGKHGIKTGSAREKMSYSQPAVFSLVYSEEESTPAELLQKTNLLLTTHSELLSDLSFLEDEAVVVLHSNLSMPELWRSFPQTIREQIRRQRLCLYSLDALQIGRESASIPGFFELYALLALLGASRESDESEAVRGLAEVMPALRSLLQLHWGKGNRLSDEMLDILQRGARERQSIDWQKEPLFTGLTPREREAPWTLQGSRQLERTVFDGGRFWDSVGYLYEMGDRDAALTDPFLATQTMPARSSTFHDTTPYRIQIPRVLAENCSGCGLCWANCPDSALPATIQDVSTALDVALKQCAGSGQSVTQMQRIAGHLAKQAERIFGADDLHLYRTLGALFTEAFEQLLVKLKPAAEQETVLRQEFSQVYRQFGDFPVIRTRRFFSEPDRLKKGSGKWLSIAVNPLSCKGCMQCVQVCPDNALESVLQTPDLLQQYRENRRFLMELPEVSRAQLHEFISEEDPDSLVFHLLNKQIYHTLPGGDGAFAGSGVKTALHLLTAAMQAVMQPRMDGFIARLDDLISQTEARLQGALDNVVKINDFDDFSRKLLQVENTNSAAGQIGAFLSGNQPEKLLEARQLQALGHSRKRLMELKEACRANGHGLGRAQLAMILGSGELLFWSNEYPYNPWSVPWLHQQTGGDLAAAAQGVFSGIMDQMADSFAVIRNAEKILDHVLPASEEVETSSRLHWRQFTPQERELCPPVLIVCDERAFRRQMLAGMSQLLSGDLPIKIAIVNGMDGLDGTPSEPGLWGLNHQNCFVLQTGTGNPGHLLQGVMQGTRDDGPALFHIYAAEPHLHGIEASAAPRQAGLAIDSRVFPLFVCHPDTPGTLQDRLSIEANPHPQSDMAPGTVPSGVDGNDETAAQFLLTPAHWAANEARFRAEFTPQPKRRWHDKMLPLTDYLQRSTEERAGFEPFIELAVRQKNPVRLAVSARMVAFVENRLKNWELLQEIAGVRLPNRSYLDKEWSVKLAHELQEQHDTLVDEYSQKLAAADQGHRQIYHQRLTQRLHLLAQHGAEKGLAKKSLRDYQQAGRKRDEDEQ